MVTNPATSSPGLAFLLATVDAFGDDWPDYWDRAARQRRQGRGLVVRRLLRRLLRAEGEGPRPLVLSYASSPPSPCAKGADRPSTRALLDTCFRQVEYAGVIAGAENPEGAQELIDFLLSRRVPGDDPGADVRVSRR